MNRWFAAAFLAVIALALALRPAGLDSLRPLHQ